MSISQILFLSFILVACDAIDTKFVIDFLRLKQSKSVVFFSCGDLSESHKRIAAIGYENLSVRVIDINAEQNLNPLKILPHSNYARTACVFDYGCDRSLSVLRQFSDYRYFNTTYSWLLFRYNNSQTELRAILWKLKSIQINSDLSIAEEIVASKNRSNYELIDVYARGRHLCQDIYERKYGNWSSDNGMITDHKYNRYYVRGNFERLQLRGTTVIDRDNITSDDVDGILSVPRIEPGIVVFVKYHYSLLTVLRDYHNFSIKYRVARGWAGRLKSGYRLGMLGILGRNEADVAASGIFQRINRHAEFDIIHQSWEFKAGFIYRITPQLSTASGGGNFFKPFHNRVWFASAFTVLIVLIVLRLIRLLTYRFFEHELYLSTLSCLVDIVGTISQQGLSFMVSSKLSVRIVVVSFLTWTLVMYNYYTSAVVGGLLSSPGKGPETVREIIDSPLVVSFRDIGYHKILFRESKSPIVREVYDKKVRTPREGQDILPVYSDIVTAAPYLKRGGYAFHCEMSEAFQDIADEFDANEICELRTANGLFNDLKLMSFVLPKRSMYTEMFRITMMRIQEVGIVKRTLKIHKISKPICQTGARVHPVELPGVSMAFAILYVGMIVSIILFTIEKFSYHPKPTTKGRAFL